MRSRKAIANITSSFILQLVITFRGFIIPRYIITVFGSGVNGLVSSITQFLGYIALIEAGIGGVTRAALYSPLAKNDTAKISGIIKATELFFKKIAFIFAGYVLLLTIFYPIIVKNNFNWFYTSSLIIILGISTFAQYYFGITYQILLQADQKQYITINVQILTTVVNTILTLLLIYCGMSIHIIKLGSSLVYIFRPIFLNYYVKNKYHINSDCDPDNSALKQRWDALGHHIAYFLHNNTDIVVLTLFTNIMEVSVYAVYNMIVQALTNIIKVFSTGSEAAFGNMIAKNEKKSLVRNLKAFDLILSIIIITFFTVSGILIIPFIKIYTYGVKDVNYIRPSFSVFIILAQAIYCLRLPYQHITLAAGKYKETRNGAFAEAAINIILSLILVNFMGLTGVAIGTCLAMAYRIIQYAVFSCKNVLNIPISYFLKRSLVNISNVFIILFIASLIPQVENNTYFNWAINGIVLTLLAFSINIITNLIFYRSEFKHIQLIIKNTVLNFKNKFLGGNKYV